MEIHHIMLRDALQFFKIIICNSYDQTRPAVFAMLYSYRQFFVGSEPPNSFRDAPELETNFIRLKMFQTDAPNTSLLDQRRFINRFYVISQILG